MAFFAPKHLGAGQFYLFTIKDSNGQSLHGRETYRLTVPPDAPVTQYWSVTIYDSATHALIRYMPLGSRSSQSPGLRVNPDGSVDIYFGPEAPDDHDPNWVPTDPDGNFEVLFRFYGPKPSLFDKSWQLPDVQLVT
jgi:hypothetical protein